MVKSVEYIKVKGKVIAIVIRNGYDINGVNFLTPENLTLQFGMHKRKSGHLSKPHKHFVIPEMSKVPVLEVFHIIKGKARVNFFDNDFKKTKSIILGTGDSLINTGLEAHSVDFLSNTKMIEVKQGPYRGKENDKSVK